MSDRWQLPDGVDELLPEAAWRVESLRRRITDRCRDWGFELVAPPLIEYLDSLLTGTGEMMNLQTFKLIDHQSGRTLGVRADMTPQVARIDAHALRHDRPNRLSYTGTVLRARTDGVGGSRTPRQFGAELFGHVGVASDIEIMRLMLETVALAGVAPEELILEVGHVGIYRGLVEQADLDHNQELRLFAALQRGSAPEVDELLAEADDVATPVVTSARRALSGLLQLRGDTTVLDTAREVLQNTSAPVMTALDRLVAVVSAMQRTSPDVSLHIDLGELRGYRYHTGMLFAVHDASGFTLAQGGRYDAIGEAFGHSRPATGFSGDLIGLERVRARLDGASPAAQPAAGSRPPDGVFVTADLLELPGVWPAIRRLRDAQTRVVTGLDGSALSAQSERCSHELVLKDSNWVTCALHDATGDGKHGE